MRTIVVIAASIASVAVAGEFLDSYFAPGKADGKQYVSEVTKGEIAKTPTWSSQQEHPPLSPQRAQQIARDQLRQLLPDSSSWILREITLAKFSDDIHWLYLVTFEPPPFGHPGEDNADFMRIVVLMNGQVVAPTVTPLPR